MCRLLPISPVRISAVAALIFSLCSPSLQAQQPVAVGGTLLTDMAPMPITCVRYLNTRDATSVLPGASISITAGQVQIQEAGQLVLRIPAAATRAQLIGQNGQRPGSDFQYSTDRASTGTGFYWFETRYADATSAPDIYRNELFLDSSGQLVSYTFVQKRSTPDPATGAREATIRCEPPSAGS